MAFDIIVDNKAEKRSISLFIDEYDFIIMRIENDRRFNLLQEVFKDYYGESEIFLNQLEPLRSEILTFKLVFYSSLSQSLQKFIDEFLNLADVAILGRFTIKFAGD